jgi:hypothetical protein
MEHAHHKIAQSIININNDGPFGGQIFARVSISKSKSIPTNGDYTEMFRKKSDRHPVIASVPFTIKSLINIPIGMKTHRMELR